MSDERHGYTVTIVSVQEGEQFKDLDRIDPAVVVHWKVHDDVEPQWESPVMEDKFGLSDNPTKVEEKLDYKAKTIVYNRRRVLRLQGALQEGWSS